MKKLMTMMKMMEMMDLMNIILKIMMKKVRVGCIYNAKGLTFVGYSLLQLMYIAYKEFFLLNSYL